jgi:DNA-binding NtrC family response regulator
VAVTELAPEALVDPSPLLDAAGAVIVLDRDDDHETLAHLTRLPNLPAGRALVLLLDDAPEDLVALALEQLRPAQALPFSAPDAMVRYAVQHTVPDESPGRGARPNQRPATALLGVSSAIHELIDQIRQIAPTQIPALILGETGTGKELVARAIHEQSPRAGQPFVAVNCAALPDSLLESELFGHVRGSFTGAERDRRGLFEDACGGTIFLDEIGDTSPAFQMKLLRVLESKEIRALGGTRVVPVDVRVVSATHHDLEQAIEEGTFRQDLYYRLNAVTLFVPPLRRRRVDIPFLAQHFAEEFGADHAQRITLEEDFLESLAEREFPGNVRELRNAVERAIALATPGEPVTRAHLEPSTASAALPSFDFKRTLKELVDEVEKSAIQAALDRTRGNRARAAALLGLTAPGLRYKLRRLGLDKAPRYDR